MVLIQLEGPTRSIESPIRPVRRAAWSCHALDDRPPASGTSEAPINRSRWPTDLPSRHCAASLPKRRGTGAVKRVVIRVLAKVDEAVDEVLYRPAVVKVFQWAPRWWLCDLAKLSMALDDRWNVGYWETQESPSGSHARPVDAEPPSTLWAGGTTRSGAARAEPSWTIDRCTYVAGVRSEATSTHRMS